MDTSRRAPIGSPAWRDELPLDPHALACRLNDVWIEATKHEPDEQSFLAAHNRRAMAANGIDPDLGRPANTTDDHDRVALLARRLHALLHNGKEAPRPDGETRRYYQHVIRCLLLTGDGAA